MQNWRRRNDEGKTGGAVARRYRTMTTMATGDDNKDVDGDGATGNEVNDDGDGATGDDNDDEDDGNDNDDDDGDGAMGSGATRYDDNNDGERRRRVR
jgi:hypothetical protein